MKGHIFSHNGHCHFPAGAVEVIHHGPPPVQVGLRTGNAQTFTHSLGEMFLLHHKWHFIEGSRIQILEHMLLLHITEHGDFLPHLVIHRIVGAAHQDIRPQPHILQLLHTHLGRFRLHLPGSLQVRNQGYMNQYGILPANLELELPDGLQEGLALNIPHRSPDLNDGDGLLLFRYCLVDPVLDLIGDVGNHLDSAPAVIPMAFLVQHGPVDLSRGHIGIGIQALIDKPLVMSQIQVCLRAIICNEHLPMLNRIHGTGIHIDIGIELLHGNVVSPGFQQPPQGCRRDSFSQPRYHASCYKYVFDHDFLLLLPHLFWHIPSFIKARYWFRCSSLYFHRSSALLAHSG